MLRILIVDDEPRIRSSLKGLLADEGYGATACESGEEGVALIREEDYDVVFLDVLLPGMDGIQVLERIRDISPGTKVLMMSGQAEVSVAVRAVKSGAHDFFEKPLNPDRVFLVLKNLADRLVLEHKVVSLEHLVEREDEMVGSSPAMRQLRQAIAKSAPTGGRVLIFGENGTGKELVARAIHHQSDRHEKPFVSLNCAALPKDLVESELFGYEKGAFTGAVRRKAGRFELADGGTLFLDEVGDMALETQAKLLRVLEENEAVRVGGGKPYRFDVRIVAATNKNLKEEIGAGRFREDLFFRLNVVPMHVPPLRERQEDIPLLAEHFLKRICERSGKGRMWWGGNALKILQSYAWPGNVRELRNFVERLVIMCDGETIGSEAVSRFLLVPDAPRTFTASSKDAGASLKEMMTSYEKEVLERGFHEAGGNVSRLARTLKIDRANLHRKLKAYGIK